MIRIGTLFWKRPTSDKNAIMFESATSGYFMRGLGTDDKVGARYFYRRPPLEYTASRVVTNLHHAPTHTWTAHPILLVNERPSDATYMVNDRVTGSFKGDELT